VALGCINISRATLRILRVLYKLYVKQ